MEIKGASTRQFTPSEAEKHTQKAKFYPLRQQDNKPVLPFNHRFEAVASRCAFSEDEFLDLYANFFKLKLGEALAIKVQDTLQDAMRHVVGIDINLGR